MIRGFTIAGNIGKAIGYMAYGLNQSIKLLGRTARGVANSVTNKPKYNVTVMDHGDIINEYKNIDGVRVNQIITAVTHLEKDYSILIGRNYGSNNTETRPREVENI
jgi:hypothetical protein|tara:strand:+ start:790 stop:1107 length:318 start_codon:yes stop_codon:yes gene_type:complete